MLRNDVSKFRVRRSKSGVVQRLNAAPRRRRLSDALAVATFAAALAYGNVDNSNAYAQIFQSNAPETQRARATSNAQRGGATAQSPLFSGKFARNVSEKFSRGDETQKQNAARRYAQTPERAAGRSQSSTAPEVPNVRNGASQRSSAVPNRAPVSGYNTPRSAAPTAAKSADALAQPSTSRESAQEALAKIPWNAISPAAREKLAALAKNPTIYRRLPMAGGYCNPELFDFFLTHPHAVVGLWRQMGYDDISMAPIGPNLYSVREKTGTVGRAQILYQDDELTLVYCSGKYQGPVVPRSLDGEMFLVLQTRYTEDPTGRPIAICRLDAFVDLKNPGADLLARTFSGALGKLADSNFEQTVAFIDNVSQTAETNPGALSASIAGLSELSPEARRLFAAKTSEIARQAQLRARGTYVDYRLLPKLNSPTPTVARVLSRERAGVGADVALAARSQTATQTPGAPPSGFNVDATPGRATSSLARSPLSQTPSTLNNFDKPSLAQNSFALSDDSESDFDFEAELDWEDEEPLKVGGARVARKPLSAPTLVPETSVAKATTRPATRFSDALELVDSNANVGQAVDYAATSLATDDESTCESDAPLLLDFENELLEETEKADVNAGQSVAATPIAKPAPLAAFPAPKAAGAVALPSLPAVSKEAPDAAASSLPVLVFDDVSESATPSVSSVPSSNETATLDDIPLLLLPDVATSNAEPVVEAPTKPDARPSAKVALKNDLPTSPQGGRVVAPIVPNAKKPTSAKPAPTSAPVWRAVKPNSAPTPTRTQTAAPIAKTASVATESGATFRQPQVN